MGIMKVVVAVGAILALGWAMLSAIGKRTWSGQTRDLLERLQAARIVPPTTHFDACELDGLPPVVQRYFRIALPDGAPIITAVSVDHSGSFNMGETKDNWQPFTSRQRVVTRRPGFVWDGQIHMGPLLSVSVHDAYVAGEGILHPAILGLFTLMDLRDTDELARGELMRFLAEAAWYPTALLPSQGVCWEAGDECSASACLKDGAQSLALTFTFGPNGLIESVRAEARGRTEGGQVVMRPWEGRWSNYQLHDGMQVPMTGEVAWLLAPEAGGRKPYWRGTIDDLSYEYPSSKLEHGS